MSRRQLAGYELEHRLGEGTASTVWRARQASALGRPVAIKRVQGDDGAGEQLRTEAAVLTVLDHPHVVRVFELAPDGDDGLAIVMQLAPGGSLDDRLRRRGPMPAAEAVDVVRKLAAALASAHRRGVLHRDVKPANVLFTADGEPLLSDFGIATWAGRDDGTIRGSAAYLDPTVRAGRIPDVTSDVYALARVAVEMLTGSVETPPADVPAPPAAVAALARALAADPAERFPSAAAFAAALAADEPRAAFAHSGPAEPAPACTSDRGDEPEDRLARVTRTFGPRPPAPRLPDPVGWSRRRVVASVAAAIALALGALTVLSGGRAGRPAPASAAGRACPSTDVATPAGAERLAADLDGDGCVETVLRLGNVLERTGPGGVVERFELGSPGDVPVLGDWDCDGRATPGVYRGAAGQAFLFDGWAAPGRPLPAVRTVAASAPPATSCR